MNHMQAPSGPPTDEQIKTVKHIVFIDVRPDQPSVLDERWECDMICRDMACYFPGCGGSLHPRFGQRAVDSVVCRELKDPFYAAAFAPIYRVDMLERMLPYLIDPAIGRVIRRRPSGDTEVRDFRTLTLNRYGPRLAYRGGPDAHYWRCPTCRRAYCGYSSHQYYLRGQLQGGLVQTCLNTGRPLVANTVLEKLRLETLPDAHLFEYIKYPLRDEPIDDRRMKVFLPLEEVKARLKKRGWKKPTKKEVKARLAEMKALGIFMSAVESEPEEPTPAKAATPAKKKRAARK